jgi:hypothetical protein
VQKDIFHVVERAALHALVNRSFDFRLVDFNRHGVLVYIASKTVLPLLPDSSAPGRAVLEWFGD